MSSGPSASTLSGVASNRFAATKPSPAPPARSGDAILGGAAHERVAALDADDVGAATRDRQREVADAAEEVGDALAGARIEQRERAPDEDAVDRRIHLREVGRRVREDEVEFGERVRELAARTDRSGAAVPGPPGCR